LAAKKLNQSNHMKLEHEFYKLPLRFDVERLKKELSCFEESDWEKHPSDYKGNLAIPLISVNGEINDNFAGPMQMTRFLKQSPYMQQVLASFDSVLSRSRLMRLEGRHDVPLHSDINAHWWSRVRIHVPIVTTPDVIFHCGNQRVHMAPGEAWIFDAWKMHKVVNPSGHTRVHLVIDTAGSPEFWERIKKSEVFSSSICDRKGLEPELISFHNKQKSRIMTEQFNMPVVMSAGEMDALVEGIVRDVCSVKENRSSSVEDFSRVVNFFRFKWRAIWSLHGSGKTGWLDYESLIARTNKELFEITSPVMSNGAVASEVMNGRVVSVAFNADLYTEYQPVSESAVNTRQPGTGDHTGAVQKSAVGRNSPCPCGSGKKYKRCHGA